MRISLAISHSPWVEERVRSYARLMKSLEPLDKFAAFRLFNEKAPNHVWSEAMWCWAAEQDVDWCVFLQDDTVVSPDFHTKFEAICSSRSEVIGLQVAHPAAPLVAADGSNYFTTNDALVGVGYAVNRLKLLEFLEWRTTLTQSLVEGCTEDTLLGTYCALAGTKIYHPVPTIVDHDVTLGSTFGNDGHQNRRSLVRWDTPLRTHLNNPRVPHLGCFYNSTPSRVEACGGPPERVKALLRDNGSAEIARLSYAQRGRGIHTGAVIRVAIPNRGNARIETAVSVWQLLRDETIDVECGFEIENLVGQTEDVVRTRSKLMREFLFSSATHLLFVDADVSFQPKVLRGMLAAKKDFIAAPYPKREGVNWVDVEHRKPGFPAEAVAYKYSLRPLTEELKVNLNGTVEVEAMPLGCALISRVCVERMVEEYSKSQYDLVFRDNDGNETTWLFSLIPPLSEDYSFCKRWRDIGGEVWMYLGAGSPVTHHGDFAYRGHIEAFGLRRGQ